MVRFDLDKLNELLDGLKGLPRIKEITALRKRLRKEKELLEKPIPVKPIVTATERRAIANVKRSTKLQRHWRFVKLVRNFFPEKPVLEIRREIAKRVKGEPSSIPDAVFQNPSP